MSKTLTGGCACGAVRYTLKSGFRMKPYACHCTDCQKRTGSAFSSHMLVTRADLTVEGELNEGHVVQPSGAVSRIAGCVKCMARIYAENDQRAGVISLRVGTLDDSKNMSPAAHFWVSSKQPWIIIPDDVPALDTQPQSSEEWMKYVGPE
ncbi:Gfa-like protein [hydrothermal vent metagenome]|uniref:Gfa-like protein n=1 Tax=hydrothermal vent metagenome TaxID=652676 RepID=A0A3B0S402_9ZZZZ